MAVRTGKTRGLWMTSCLKIASVLIKSKNKVLLLRRSIKGTQLEGYWSVPCGAIEKDEAPWVGAKRELYEETLIKPKGELKYLNKFPITYHREFYVYLYESPEEIKPDIENARDGHEHDVWAYFPINNLPVPIDENLKKTILMTQKM
jgi:8-oxo-dGTP pyrophosphatase MutT (NUDIX family)